MPHPSSKVTPKELRPCLIVCLGRCFQCEPTQNVVYRHMGCCAAACASVGLGRRQPALGIPERVLQKAAAAAASSKRQTARCRWSLSVLVDDVAIFSMSGVARASI